MNKQFKPNGYNSASPYLMVEDAQRLINLLEHIFDAVEKRRYTHPDGSIMHAELKIDDSVIMLAEANDRYPAYPLWMHVYVPDVDSIFEKAVRFGCEVMEKPTERPGDPDRRGTFRDFAGNHWAIGMQL